MKKKALRNRVLGLSLSLLMASAISFGQWTSTRIAGGSPIEPSYPATAATASTLEIGAAGPMAVAPNGDIAWADYFNGGLIYWDASEDEMVNLVARGSETTGLGGPAVNATVGDRIYGVAFDNQNNVYFSTDSRVLMVDEATKTLTHIAGNGSFTSHTPVDVSLPFKEMSFHAAGLVFNEDDTKLFVNALNNHQVLELDMVGMTARILMGTGVRADDGTTGLGYEKDTREPFGIDYVKDPDTGVEWLYVCTQQKRVHKFNLQTMVRSLLAGNGGWGYSGDGGLAVDAQLKQPHDISVDPTNTAVYFGDHQANVVRKVDLKTGLITKFAGTNESGDALTGNDGPAGEAILLRPIGTDFDPDGNMIITERTAQLIRKVDMTTNTISVVTGTAPAPEPPLPSDGLLGTLLDVNARGVVAWGTDVYFFDANTSVIVKLADDGTTSVYGGVEGESGFNGGGALDTAQFGEINEMILDSNGDIYASDRVHHVIYKIDVSEGIVEVVAGTGGSGGYVDSIAATEAKLNQPEGMAFNADESILYINDKNNYCIRWVDMGTGMIYTYAGVPGSRGEVTSDTPLAQAQFRDNRGICVDADGNVYVGSSRYHNIYKMDGTTASVFATGFSAPLDLFFAAGLIWVSDNGTVKVVDPATGATEIVNNDVPGSYSLFPALPSIYVTGQANGVYEMTQDPASTLAMIQGYADSDDASALTLEMLNELGASVIEFNLDAYKAAVADSTAATLPYISSVQELVEDVNQQESDATIAIIDGLAAANDATALELFHLAITGMNNVVDGNLQAYRDVMENPDTTGVADVAALQAIIDQGNVNVALAEIDAMAAGNDATDLTFQLIKDAGADPANIIQSLLYLEIYKGAVELAAEVKDTADLNGLLAAANALAETQIPQSAIDSIDAMADASDASMLTFQMLKLAGADESIINFMYLEYYKEGVAAADTVEDAAALNAILDAANVAGDVAEAANALAAINDMAVASDASMLTKEQLEAAGATGMIWDVAHFETYRAGVEAADGVADLAALQAIVDAANLQLAIDKIVGFAEADDASSMTGNDLVAAGVDLATVNAANLVAYQDSVAGSAGTEVDATAKIQALVDEVNVAEEASAIALIQAMATAGDASALTTELLEKANLTYDGKYLEEYKEAIAAAGDLADKAAIQSVLDATATCAMVREMPGTNDAANLTIGMLTELGIVNTFEVLLVDYYQMAVFDVDTIENCDASLQGIVDGANWAAVADMASFSDATNLSVELMAAVGATDALAENLDCYKSSVEDSTELADVAALQAIVDACNSVNVAAFDAEHISIYPNPSDGRFTIALRRSGVALSVVDMTGRTVLEKELLDTENVIELSDEFHGVYFLKLRSGSEVVISKLVIE